MSKIPGLAVILVVQTPRLRALNLAGVPHIHFPPYSRAESVHIVSSSPLALHDQPQNDLSSSNSNPVFISDDDRLWLWTRFVTAVWDSIGQAAARDLVSFRAVCEKLWNPFVKPILDGQYGPREFSKLMVKNRALFQSELPLKESVLPVGILDPAPDPTRGMQFLLIKIKSPCTPNLRLLNYHQKQLPPSSPTSPPTSSAPPTSPPTRPLATIHPSSANHPSPPVAARKAAAPNPSPAHQNPKSVNPPATSSAPNPSPSNASSQSFTPFYLRPLAAGEPICWSR